MYNYIYKCMCVCIYMICVSLCGSGFTVMGNNHLPAELTATTTSHPDRKGEHRASDHTRHRSMARKVRLSQEIKIPKAFISR